MLSLTMQQALTAEHWTIDHPYRLYVVRENDTIFYVGLSRDPFYRLREHTGLGEGTAAPEPSRVGDLFLRFLPDSLSWNVDLYTLDDCTLSVARIAGGGYLHLYKDNKGRLSAEKWCIEIAEEALIEVLRPCLNTSQEQKNTNASPGKISRSYPSE